MMGEINPEIFEVEKVDSVKDKLTEEVIHDLIIAKAELANAIQNYDFADSDELVDLYSYRIIAAQTQYNRLLKQAKEKGLSNPEFLSDNVKIVRR